MESFRSEVKIWLQENCPEGVRGPAREEDTVWGGRILFGQVKMLDFGYKQWAKRLDLPNLAEKIRRWRLEPRRKHDPSAGT